MHAWSEFAKQNMNKFIPYINVAVTIPSNKIDE